MRGISFAWFTCLAVLPPRLRSRKTPMHFRTRPSPLSRNRRRTARDCRCGAQVSKAAQAYEAAGNTEKTCRR